jgi:uncharacterized repeat protein (TIGR03803 family)
VGSDGNLYGVARSGGAYGNGLIFQFMPSGSGWTENVLYGFGYWVPPGTFPPTLVRDGSGNLYSTDYGYISNPDGDEIDAVIFMLSRSNGNWGFTELYSIRPGFYGCYPYGCYVSIP